MEGTLNTDLKPPLRQEARERRRALAEDEVFARQAAIAAAGHVCAAIAALPVASDAVIGVYWSHGNELDTAPLMARLAQRGHGVALPVVAAPGAPLVFKIWTPETRLDAGAYGIPAPAGDAPTATPAVFVLPLLAFDATGARLGYGGGYYDRTLRALRADQPVHAIGLGYAGQEMPSLPTHGGDEALDAIVTEQGIRWITRESDA